jgi:uncharacterized protein
MSKTLRRRDFIAGAVGITGAALTAGKLAAAISPAGGISMEASGIRRGHVSRGPENALGDFAPETDPFRLAVINGDVEKVTRALERDPGLLYARDANGQSVYLLAAYAGQKKMLALFESKGLVQDAYEAAAGGKVDRFNELMRPAPGLVNAPNPAGDTPIHVAALCGQSTIVDNAITYGMNFKQGNPKRKNATAMHLGLQSPFQMSAEAMGFDIIANGMEPNAATSDGDTLLHSAARGGYPRMVRLLVQKGADVNARNAAGQTALDIATASGKTEAAALLRNANSIPVDYYARRFEYGPKFAALTRDDTQGLPRDFINAFIVLCHFNIDRVKKLVELAPELLNTRASWDELPVEAGAHMGRPDMGGHLLDRGASYSLCTATVFGSLDDMKRMLAEDSQRIHERGAHSFPLLWYTAFGKPQLDKAEYLIGAGAYVKEDMRGLTVLHMAAQRGHLEMCRFLVEKGLDPLQKGTNFQGTFDAVEAAEQGKHADVAAMLRDWAGRKKG